MVGRLNPDGAEELLKHRVQCVKLVLDVSSNYILLNDP